MGKRRQRLSAARVGSQTFAGGHGVPLPAAAIAFPLAHPAVVGVCLGARSPQQIGRSSDLYRLATPAALWSELKRGRSAAQTARRLVDVTV